jgi:uncharacterized protein YecE (DUF72 family)
MPDVRIGVSGWKYPHWRGDFYPAGMRQAEELTYLTARMDSVEINGSFYALQKPETYASWRAATPDGFVFAVKGGRYLTHMKKLLDPEPGLANFFASGPLTLGDRLGPFLWQLPATLPFDEHRLEHFLHALPRTGEQATALARRAERFAEPAADPGGIGTLRHALEPRHASYHDPRCLALLREFGVALVLADTAGTFPQFDDTTTDFVYVRLHGPDRLYHGAYGPGLIGRWAARVREWRAGGHDVYVYFDNDADGAAPWDAIALADALR